MLKDLRYTTMLKLELTLLIYTKWSVMSILTYISNLTQYYIIQLVSYIDNNSLPLLHSYDVHLLQPLKKNAEKIQKNHPRDIEAQFKYLLTYDQTWYNLLLAIGFSAGDDLPFVTDAFTLPLVTPDELAKSKLIKGSSDYIQKIESKFQTAELNRVVKMVKEQTEEEERAKKAVEKAEKDHADKLAKLAADALAAKVKVNERNKQRLDTTTQAFEKEQKKAAVLQARLEEFKSLVAELQTGTMDDEGLTKLQTFCKDPSLAALLSDSDSSTMSPTSIADAINHIREAAFVDNLSTSQSKPGIKAHPFFGQLKKESSGKSNTVTSDIIDITNDSDNEYDMDDKAHMKGLIHQLPWKMFGLTTEVVTPTLNAIKKMEDKDKELFSNEHNVKEIFRLGLQALKTRQSIQGESSYASDSSNKRSRSKDADNSPQSRRKTRKVVLDRASFTENVTKNKGKGKARQRQVTPEFTSDGDEMDEDDGSLVSPTGEISWLDNF